MNSKRKGKVGERELSKALASHFPGKWERTAQHCGKDGTADIRGCIPGVHWECKRVAAIAAEKFMEQAERDAGDACPVVGMRANRGEWMILLRLSDLPELARCIDGYWSAKALTEDGGAVTRTEAG